MTKHVLLSWIGKNDLRHATSNRQSDSPGPIGQAVMARSFSHVYFLSDHDSQIESQFDTWIKSLTKAETAIIHVELSSPTHFGQIYEAAVSAIAHIKERFTTDDLHLSYHLSPGTPAMAAVWMLLAKTAHPAELIESSRQEGVKSVSLPFDIAAEYLPDPRPADDQIVRLTQGLPPEAPEFDAIVYRSETMRRLVLQARQLAVHQVPVLIQGESGTGKELLARAIHASSRRAQGAFIAVNCGAIPPELVEVEFFGHAKGAFTGATQSREGYLKSADGGTLFLDEIGELPLNAQVKLLRALESGAVQKVGSSKTRQVDIRIIAATNRNLIQAMTEGDFREDLFHRLAVGVLNLPPLRHRLGDLNLIIDHILNLINRDCAAQTDWIHKKLSASARNLLHQHPWPGNVRELFNTLSRVAIWTTGDTIQAEDISAALFPVPGERLKSDILNQSLDNNIDIQNLISEVASHYLERALEAAEGNKTKAAALVGLPSYQTFSNWMQKYGIESGTDIA
jgi:DNA-binding NtrC family response regulator